MKHLFVALATIAVAVAATLASLHISAAPAASGSLEQQSLAGPPLVLTQYGHIRSLMQKGGRFELQLDPAWWLGGVTANRAAIADNVIAPGETAPNDYYIRDERRRALTFIVPATARVTVVTNPTGGLRSTAITVSELAQIVKGGNPKHRRLFDRSNSLGFWVRLATDTARSLDQQYQP